MCNKNIGKNLENFPERTQIDLVQHGDTNCALDTGKELRKGFQALSEQEAENRIKYAYFNILLYTNVYIYI